MKFATACLLLLAILVVSSCEVRRAPGPESTRQVRVAAVRRILDQPALSPAAWSPDGTHLAFSGPDGLAVASLDGSVRKIAAASVATSVSWSAHLDLLAVVDRGALRVMLPDGSGERRIEVPGFVTAAVWAPGSDRLGVVLRHPVDGIPRFELWLVNRDGGFRRMVTRAPTGKAIRDLQWFPNSLYLLYGLTAPSDPVATEVWRVRISYPDRGRIPVPGPVLTPRLSPSGRAIAYLAGEEIEDGKGRVTVSRLDGTGRRVLTPETGRYSGLAWSPQGDKLAFVRAIDEAHAEIWIADADGSGRLLLHDYALEFSDPSIALSTAWAPDGRRIVFGTNTGTFTGPIWVAALARR